MKRNITPKPRRKATDFEHQEQSALFHWAVTIGCRKYPELHLMFAIPNGGARHKAVAGKLKAEGVKAGVPDIFLPAPRGKYHGLFIEMKRCKESGRSSVTPGQRAWINTLNHEGYKAVVCYGWDEAKVVITSYLTIE